MFITFNDFSLLSFYIAEFEPNGSYAYEVQDLQPLLVTVNQLDPVSKTTFALTLLLPMNIFPV